MMSIRITLTLDEVVVTKLREISPNNLSAFVNEQLYLCLFQKKSSLAGSLKGRISTKDIIRDEDHDI